MSQTKSQDTNDPSFYSNLAAKHLKPVSVIHSQFAISQRENGNPEREQIHKRASTLLIESSNQGNEKIPISSRVLMSHELTVREEKPTTSSKVSD